MSEIGAVQIDQARYCQVLGPAVNEGLLTKAEAEQLYASVYRRTLALAVPAAAEADECARLLQPFATTPPMYIDEARDLAADIDPKYRVIALSLPNCDLDVIESVKTNLRKTTLQFASGPMQPGKIEPCVVAGCRPSPKALQHALDTHRGAAGGDGDGAAGAGGLGITTAASPVDRNRVLLAAAVGATIEVDPVAEAQRRCRVFFAPKVEQQQHLLLELQQLPESARTLLKGGSFYMARRAPQFELGRGVSGVVRLGIHVQSHADPAPVAIKTFSSDHPAVPSETELLRVRELTKYDRARIHFVTAIDVFTRELEEVTQQILVMELCIGSLEQCVELFSQLTVLERRGIVQQLADALHYLHSECSIVHRDLRPANVLVNQRGAVKLTDFGLARPVKNLARYSHVAAMELQAPEVLEALRDDDPAPVTEAGDVYQLGGLFFYILSSGRYAHSFAKSPRGEDDAVSQGRPLATPELQAQMPFEPLLVSLIEQCMTHDREQRLTMDEVKDHPYFWTTERRKAWLDARKQVRKKGGG